MAARQICGAHARSCRTPTGRGARRRREAPRGLRRARASPAGVPGAARREATAIPACARPLGDDRVMRIGRLRHIQRCDVESERAHAPDEASHEKIAGMPSAVVDQAVGRELDVGEQLSRVLVGVGPALVGRLEPLADLAEVDAIRHTVVPRGRQPRRAGQQGRVGLDAPRQLTAQLDAARALAERFGKMAALVEVSRHDELLVAMERLADGLRVHLIVAFHISADPGAEPQNARHDSAIRPVLGTRGRAPSRSPRRTAAPPGRESRSDRTARARARRRP